MKHIFVVMMIVLVCAALCTPAMAQATTVCQGLACGCGGGMLQYQYAVNGGGCNVVHFYVAVNDLNMANYGAFMMPPGWLVGIVPGGPYLTGPFTPAGIPHMGPVGPSAGYVAFWDPTGVGIAGGVFGFNHPWAPMDADWEQGHIGGLVLANWAAPVGLGFGPVHAP